MTKQADAQHASPIAGAKRVGVALALALAATAGCSSSDSAPAADRARWTLLYYVDADNDREAERLEHVENLAAVGSTDDVNVIVLIDRNANDNTHVYGPGDLAEDGPLLNLGQFVDAKLLKVEQDNLTVLQELGEIDMGSPQTFGWFLTIGFERFPAEHYGVVVDDHGGGIIGAAWDDSTPLDAEGHTSFLSMADMTSALRSSFAATGVERVDLFGFDACLMGNVDTALKLAPYADYLVASEEMTNGRQWDDTALLRAATDNSRSTGAELGRAVANNQDGADFWQQRTYSVIDLRRMSGVGQALASFSRAILDTGEQSLAELGRARSQSLHFGRLSAEEDAALFDIGDLVAHLQGVPPAVTTAANALYAAVRQATVTVVSGPLSEAATGLAIVFPASADEFPFDYPPFAAVPEWAAVLDRYHASADPSATPGPADPPPGPRFQSPHLTLTPREGGVVARAELVPGTVAGVVAAEMLAGSLQTDASIHFLMQGPAVVGSGAPDTVAASWDFRYFQITDGTATLDTTTFRTRTANGIRASIPLIYQTPSGEQTRAALQFTLDAGGSATALNLFGMEPSGATTDLAPTPGSVVAPLVYIANPAGAVTLGLASSQALDATRLRLTTAMLGSGTPYAMALLAADSAGRSAAASGVGIVPAV